MRTGRLSTKLGHARQSAAGSPFPAGLPASAAIRGRSKARRAGTRVKESSAETPSTAIAPAATLRNIGRGMNSVPHRPTKKPAAE